MIQACTLIIVRVRRSKSIFGIYVDAAWPDRITREVPGTIIFTLTSKRNASPSLIETSSVKSKIGCFHTSLDCDKMSIYDEGTVVVRCDLKLFSSNGPSNEHDIRMYDEIEIYRMI